MLHTLMLILENERKKNLYITERYSQFHTEHCVSLEIQTVKCSTLKIIDDGWKNYRENIVDFVERLKSFNAKPSGTRVLGLSYTFMFNKRHQPSEHLLNSYKISGCQFSHHEGVRER